MSPVSVLQFSSSGSCDSSFSQSCWQSCVQKLVFTSYESTASLQPYYETVNLCSCPAYGLNGMLIEESIIQGASPNNQPFSQVEILQSPFNPSTTLMITWTASSSMNLAGSCNTYYTVISGPSVLGASEYYFYYWWAVLIACIVFFICLCLCLAYFCAPFLLGLCVVKNSNPLPRAPPTRPSTITEIRFQQAQPPIATAVPVNQTAENQSIPMATVVTENNHQLANV